MFRKKNVRFDRKYNCDVIIELHYLGSKNKSCCVPDKETFDQIFTASEYPIRMTIKLLITKYKYIIKLITTKIVQLTSNQNTKNVHSTYLIYLQLHIYLYLFTFHYKTLDQVSSYDRGWQKWVLQSQYFGSREIKSGFGSLLSEVWPQIHR